MNGENGLELAVGGVQAGRLVGRSVVAIGVRCHNYDRLLFSFYPSVTEERSGGVLGASELVVTTAELVRVHALVLR